MIAMIHSPSIVIHLKISKAKSTKMMNCACVSFTLESGELPGKGTVYRVDPKSIVPICNSKYNVGFEGKK